MLVAKTTFECKRTVITRLYYSKTPGYYIPCLYCGKSIRESDYELSKCCSRICTMLLIQYPSACSLCGVKKRELGYEYSNLCSYNCTKYENKG